MEKFSEWKFIESFFDGKFNLDIPQKNHKELHACFSW